MGESESAEQTDAVILGGREAVADDDGAADNSMDAGFEDVRSATRRRGTWRLRKPYWLHSDGLEVGRKELS